MSSTMIKRGNVTVVRFEGQISYESVQPVLEETKKLAKNHSKHKIVFNFNDARFVGSNNITRLLRSLKSFRKTKNIETTFCCVNSEFLKMIRAFQGRDPVEVFESEDAAIGKLDN